MREGRGRVGLSKGRARHVAREKPLDVRLQILRERAEARWQQKLAYAQQRLKAEGWEAACHGYASGQLLQ